MACLAEETVMQFLAGALPADQVESVDDHVDSCPSCRQLLRLVAKASDSTAATVPALGSVDLAMSPTAADIGARVPASLDAELVGAHVGRYVVQGVLGKGGMGVVYAAFDPELDRKVAVKLLRPELAEGGGEAAAARLLREGRAIAKLAHPNVVAVFDVGTHAGAVFVAMELVDGRSLDVWIHDHERSWQEIVAVFLQAGAGLIAAHTAGMVHRDFKPANVLMGNDGRARVTDFGLARLGGTPDAPKRPSGTPLAAGSGDAVVLTRTGAVMGTPAFMAPEQFEAGSVDARTDQFSFAVALYEALYGERPFAGVTASEVFANILDENVRPPNAAPVPPWLRQVVLRGLRLKPDDRHPTLAAMLDDLRRDPAAKRRRLAIGAAGFVGVGAVAAITGAMLFGRHDMDAPCANAPAQLASAWGPIERVRVTAAFTATGQPFARETLDGTFATLDAWGRRWISAHTEACEATHVHHKQSAELLDRRMACLDDRKHELAVFVGLLAGADAGLVATASQAAYRLSEPQSCTARTLAAIAPPPASATTEVTRLRGELATARALSTAGKYDDSIARVTPMLAGVQKLGYRPLEAEALYVLGEAQVKKNDAATAQTTFQNAQLAAEAARDDDLAAHIAIKLVDAVAYRQAKHDQADAMIARAAAAIERLGGDEALTAMLDYYRGAIALESGKTSDALVAYRRAYAHMIPSLGPEHPYTIAALDARGAAELMLGKLDEAVATETLALQLTERAQGVEHPDVAFALDKLGAGLRQLNRLPEARVALERSVKLRSRNPNDPYYGASLINLGDLERVENHMEKAYELNKRATDVLLRTLGPEHQYVTEALQGQSWLALELGHPREALDTAKRALASVEKHPESQYWPILLTRFGEAQSALGAHDEAIAALEKAIATVAKWPDAEPQTRAEPRFALAKALRAAKRDNARSIALAKEARALYAPIPLGANDVARIDAWLAGDRSGPH